MRLRRAWPLMLVSLALAACGGDEEESPGAGAETDRDRPAQGSGGRGEAERTETARGDERPPPAGGAADYRRRANALCAADEKAAKALPEPRTPEGILRYFRQILSLSERSEPRYRALRPPAGLRAGHAAYLRTGDRAQELVRDLIEGLEAGGNPAVVTRGALPRLGRLVDESNRRARDLGLEDCVEELSPEGAESPESTF